MLKERAPLSVLFFPMAQKPLVGVGLLINKTSLSQSVGLLWMSDQPVAETSTWQLTTLTIERQRVTSMPPAGFEPTIPASQRPQTYASDRAATAIVWTNIHRFRKCETISFIWRNFLVCTTNVTGNLKMSSWFL